MSQARHEEGTVTPDSLPVRALSRVVPQSVQLAKDHAVLGKSIWCGTVFSLAIVLTVLNFLPPIDVGYRVTAQVVASPQRLAQLNEHLKRTQSGADQGSEAVLLGVRLLDEHSSSTTESGKATSDRLTLIEVISLWPGRTTSGRVHRWLNELSKVDSRTIRQIDTAAAERFSRWEVQAQQHYLNHFQHTRPTEQREDRPVGRIVSMGESTPMRFASLSLHRNTISDAQRAADAETEARLVQELDQATTRQKAAAAAAEKQVASMVGVLTISGSPRVRAQSSQVPSSLIFSVLILTVAGGALGGWAHYRAQSGGTFYASEVASSMSAQGLPVLGHLLIENREDASTSAVLGRRVTSYRRLAVKQLLALSELIVMFWCLAIVIRLVLDPMWRAMLGDNPLAALGRLFLGLP